MEEEEKKEYVVHKVNAGYKYTIYRNENNNGKVFYKMGVSNTLMDGQKEWAYIPVKFKNGVELKDKTQIKIKQAFENFYYAQSDTKHWNPILSIFIQDFETIDDKIEAYSEALQEAEFTVDEPPF